MSNSLATLFGFNRPTTPENELPEIFPLPVAMAAFIQTDVVTIYSKILTDVLERTQGLTPEQSNSLYDNCVKSNASDGLITLLSKAMTDKADLFIVYEKAVGVVRRATGTEQNEIRSDYEKQAKSSKGIFVSFKNFTRADMVKLYSALEYCTVASLYKSMNVAKATQLKFHELRANVSLNDSSIAKEQAQRLAKALSEGKDVMLDEKDSIENATPDTSSTEASMKFLNHKRAFYLGMPASYLTGEQTGGLSTTGEGDQKAVERGLKNYFTSIMKPVLDELFGIKVTYNSQDFALIASSMEVLKTFSLIDDTLVSHENKVKIANGLLGLPENSKGDEPPKVDPKALPAPAPVPPKTAESSR